MCQPLYSPYTQESTPNPRLEEFLNLSQALQGNADRHAEVEAVLVAIRLIAIVPFQVDAQFVDGESDVVRLVHFVFLRVSGCLLYSYMANRHVYPTLISNFFRFYL